MKTFFIMLVVVFTTNIFFVKAEEFFRVEIEETNIANAPAIHSGAVFSYNGNWFIIGGKTNGLHGFNAIDPFSLNNSNQSIYVINPTTQNVSSISTTSLPIELRQAITVNNMQFYKEDSTLYLIGGYGWNDSAQQFLTSRALVAVNLKLLNDVVINQGNNLADCFRIIKDERLAVTGAHLRKIDSTYYLVFGHLFDGTYSRTGGIATQRYTREIKKFNIEDDGVNLSISNYNTIYDSLNFRRRDYNLAYQVFPNRTIGLTAFTGVFLETINQPYLNTIDITASGYNVNNTFNQNLSQYHNAVMPIYDSVSNFMHTVFFGGMAMYYRDSVSNTIVYDSNVPFIRTLSMVTRDSLNNMTEYELTAKFPAFLGTNAEFIINNDTAVFSKDILHLNKLSGKTLVGYIYGGIESPEKNISDIDPGLSFPSSRIFKVYLNKNPEDTTITNAINVKVEEPLQVKTYPNPFKNSISFEIENKKQSAYTLSLYDASGAFIKTLFAGNDLSKSITWQAKQLSKGIYYAEIKTATYRKWLPIMKH